MEVEQVAYWAHSIADGGSHLKQKVVFEDPLHRDHQEILQFKFPLLDLHGTLLWRKIISTGQQLLKGEFQNK